jgi:mono/diheme cytochrome c family protein
MNDEAKFFWWQRLLAGWCRRVVAVAIALVLVAGLYLANRFLMDEPVVYGDIAQHFKYGSTGGERESGFPYLVWKALPELCADKLPGKGYASLGLLFEGDRDLPVGVSKRHVTGIDRVFLNCAVCHASTVRDRPDATPRLVLGMPANNFNVMAFQKFFFECAASSRFTPEYVIAAIEGQGHELDVLDRYLVYPLAVYLMQDRIRMLAARFAFADRQVPWGPGRVDTFNFAKAIFNFPADKLAPAELAGVSDFPSIWLQRPRKAADMQLHWDGNNRKVEERNLSAAFGTGATPPTVDHRAIGRVEDWLLDLPPPAYPYPVDKAAADRGRTVYGEYCSDCHGRSGRDFSGAQVGKVTPIGRIGTDRGRLDSYTYELAVNQGQLYAGYEKYWFRNFRKTHGYANMPLDGVWLRAPYLHNGSVPTLRDLLEPAARRPRQFYRGYDVYDRGRVGFVADVAREGERRFHLIDTTAPGNSNRGHEGEAYGTTLSAADKDALVEYLKTF